MLSYDVIIIGSGPAGIFASCELVKQTGLKVLAIEKGGDIHQRSCSMLSSGVPCVQCGLCGVLRGQGGAGVTRGLIQASISGIVAAREIVKRWKR